jgi:hypothetical protein
MITPEKRSQFREFIALGLSLEEAARACEITAEEATKIWNTATVKDGRNGDVSTELDQIVEYFNERFFIIGNMGGKCRVCWHEDDPGMPGRRVLGAQIFGDFRNRFDHIKVTVGHDKNHEPIQKGQGEAYLGHYARRQFDTITFAPGQKLGRKVYNLWQEGFAYQPTEGDCSLYLEHIRENICSGNQELYEWVVNWLAYAVQRPGEQGHTAIALRGEKGTGKNFFADKFGKLWGNHYFAVSEPEHVIGRFNSHLRECCVLFANEAFFAGDPRHEQILKTLITDELLPIEQKFQDLVTCRNYLHLIISSNADWFLPTSMDERRFCVLDVSDAHRGDKPYFKAIEDQLDAGGYEALLWTLLHRDLKNFSPRTAPRTSGLDYQIARSLKGAEAAWFQCLHLGTVPGQPDEDGRMWLRGIDLIEWAKKHDPRLSGIKAEDLGYLFTDDGRHRVKKPMDFKKARPVVQLLDGTTDKVRVNAWNIPSLAECRKLWNKLRFEVRWDNPKDIWDSTEEKF